MAQPSAGPHPHPTNPIMRKSIVCLLAASVLPALLPAEGYESFDLSVYSRVHETVQMKDTDWLARRIDYLERFMHVEKFYIETHRDLVVADKETVLKAKSYLESRGIEVAGGITLVRSEPDHFRAFCYSDPEQRKQVHDIVTFTASLFDEIILDDFYFTNCKCDLCIQQKGDRTWADFRMKQLTDFARTEIVEAAKAVNPKVKVIIKYPNWYEHFHYLGFNLEEEPLFFDGIYTGTETRDGNVSHQHLQPYQSYGIMRYFENIAPGRNGGGWIDPYGRNHLDRYGEQISLTAFAKPKEITLFAIHVITDEMLRSDGTTGIMSPVAPVAGYVLEKADHILPHLGNPVGIPAYRPYHSVGEDFLHQFLGMTGLPIEMVPSYPEDAHTILLTQGCAKDTGIVEKIKKSLSEGKNVVITSGLAKALEGKGLESIVDLRVTDRKSVSREFSNFFQSVKGPLDVLIPQIIYPTNDSWEVVTAYDQGNGYPLLLQANYSSGMLYVLTIPDNFNDLYDLPAQALTWIKRVLNAEMPLTLEAESRIGLFLYDNDTFIVHSFLDERQLVTAVPKVTAKSIVDLHSGETIQAQARGDQTVFPIMLPPHEYRAFRIQR